MAWVNPLDYLIPQIPVDWANHIVQGGIAGELIYYGSKLIQHPVGRLEVTLIILAIAGAKKLVDYFKENESVVVCVGKTIATALIPAMMLLP